MGKILVIDDEEPIRAMLRQALESAGHEVVEAGDGKEAIRSYLQQLPDLVITDIVMPEREGLECILELRKLNPELKIMAVSGGGRLHMMNVLEVARRFGACRTFPKPFDIVALVCAVQEELERRPAA